MALVLLPLQKFTWPLSGYYWLQNIEKLQEQKVPYRRGLCPCPRQESTWTGKGKLILTSALGGGEWSTSRPATAPPRKNPGTHWIGDWVGPRAVWTFWRREKCLAPVGIRTPARQPVVWSLLLSLTRLFKLFDVGVKFCHSVREEQRLRVFEKRVLLRTVFEPKKEEVVRAGPSTAGLGPGGEIFLPPPLPPQQRSTA